MKNWDGFSSIGFFVFVVVMVLFVLLPIIGDGNRRSKNDDI